PATTDVVVNDLPTPTAANGGPVCVGDALTLTGGPSGMSGYSWTGPSGFTSSEQSPTVSGAATLAMAGTYSLTVTNGSGCTSSSPATTDVVVELCNNPPEARNLDLETCALGTGSAPEDEWITFMVTVDDADIGTFGGHEIRFPADEVNVLYGSVVGNLTDVDYSAGTATVQFTYVPPAGFVGTDFMEFTAYDPYGESTTGTVTIVVVDCRAGGGGGEYSIKINEVAWAGTDHSSEHEWIELHNMEFNPAAAKVDLKDWVLAWRHRETDSQVDPTPITSLADFRARCVDEPCWEIELSGAIGPDGYYLLERYVNKVVDDINADLVYADAEPYDPDAFRLSDSIGEEVYLFDADGKLVSSANTDYAARHPGEEPWPAGSLLGGGLLYASMELETLADEREYDIDEDWSTNQGVIIFGIDASHDPLTATARTLNEAFILARLLNGNLSWLSIRQGEALTLSFSLRELGEDSNEFPRVTVLSASETVGEGGAVPIDAVMNIRRVDTSTGLAPNLVVVVDTSLLPPGEYWVFVTVGSGVFHTVEVHVTAS
ncbi:immunoglobulin domain-containing protein, partial [Candidatus Bipolaricaulota bacterium]|nr:immunoglobulin domain-containing protein [Candidatus Bipolaricaulota bacterium]